MASAVKRRAHICFSSSCSFCRVLAPSGCQPVAGVARDPLPPQSPSFLKFPGYLAGSDGVWCRARGQTPRGMRFFDVFQWHYQIRAEQTHPEQAAPPRPLHSCTELRRCSAKVGAGKAEPPAPGRAWRSSPVWSEPNSGYFSQGEKMEISTWPVFLRVMNLREPLCSALLPAEGRLRRHSRFCL